MPFLQVIEGFPNYAVNRVGQVLNIRTGKVLKCAPVQAGYSVANLYRDGLRSTHLVHRLVLAAFRGLPPDGQVCAHGNGIRTDNRLENLRWATGSENSADRVLHGTDSRGSKSPTAKITEAQVDQIRAMLGRGVRQRDIAAKFGLNQGTISSIHTGRNWSHYKSSTYS